MSKKGPHQSKVIVCHANQQIEVRTIPLRDLADGEVCVQTLFSAISPGTELRCWRRLQPGGAADSYVPGYSMAGRVIASRSEKLQSGDLVYCSGTVDTGEYSRQWGGHCEYAITAAESCVRLPAGIRVEDAAIAALGGIAMHGVRQAPPAPGEATAIVGLGILGQLVARILASRGASCLGLDLSAQRVDMLRAQGIRAVQSGNNLAQKVMEVLPEGVTLLFDVTGAPAVIPQAMMAIADLPWDQNPETPRRYVIQGSYPDSFSIPYQPAFVRQLSFIIPRNRQQVDEIEFLELVSSGKIRVSDLIHDVVPPEQFAMAYERLSSPDQVTGTFLVNWQD